jgi:hypothetical protein
MLNVAQPYFESDDFRGDVILYAAFPHPLLKQNVRTVGIDRIQLYRRLRNNRVFPP